MLIHLLDVTNIEGKRIEKTAEFQKEAIEFQLGSYPVLEKTPVELAVTNTGSKVLEIEGRCTLKIAIPCSRCLEEVPVEFPLQFSRKVDMKLSEEERINDLDESAYITGFDLDVDRLVCLEVLMSWPLRVLCKEDCKGICSQCGKNLNEGPCGCKEEPKDPRMAAISDIFSKFKEV